MRTKLLLVAVGISTALASSYALERDAHACGGCFGPPPSPTESPQIVTDHRMILTIAQGQSTLYDQIKYSGSPSSFAWVLPISGTVDVGLSADIVFQTLDGVTQTSIVAPPRNCPPPPTCNRGGSSGGAFGASSDSPSSSGSQASDAGAPPPVVVTKQEVVGPYETVQLKATDANALEAWLQTNGFTIPPDIQPVINKYVTEKFDFLALKLLPGKGVTDMRPVRVTTKGTATVLPLRMVAAGAGATVGITLWVLGEGRYESLNFPNFAFGADDLAWDWNQNRSNYTDLRAQKTAENKGRAWETESSTALLQQQVESSVKNSYSYPYPTPPQPTDGGAALDPNEARAQVDYLPVKDAQGNITKTAVQVRDEDLSTLFHGIPNGSSRVTRMRADLTKAALDVDLIMLASKDQVVLPTVRQLTKELNQPLCPIYSADGCNQIGTAPRDEAAARADGGGQESFSCSTSGSGSSSTWMGAGAGFLALAIARARRRRRA